MQENLEIYQKRKIEDEVTGKGKKRKNQKLLEKPKNNETIDDDSDFLNLVEMFQDLPIDLVKNIYETEKNNLDQCLRRLLQEQMKYDIFFLDQASY